VDDCHPENVTVTAVTARDGAGLGVPAGAEAAGGCTLGVGVGVGVATAGVEALALGVVVVGVGDGAEGDALIDGTLADGLPDPPQTPPNQRARAVRASSATSAPAVHAIVLRAGTDMYSANRRGHAYGFFTVQGRRTGDGAVCRVSPEMLTARRGRSPGASRPDRPERRSLIAGPVAVADR